MKTKIITLVSVLFLSINLANASNPVKKYSVQSFLLQVESLFKAQEAEVDDIPFNTKEVYIETVNPSHYNEAIKLIENLRTQEADVDDIPFDTAAIANRK